MPQPSRTFQNAKVLANLQISAAKAVTGLLLVITMMGIGTRTQAQLAVKNSIYAPHDPERLIRDVFLGEGVEVLSVVYDGPREAVGYFSEGSAPVGLSEGILLTTGLSASSPLGVGADGTSELSAQYDNASTVRDANLESIVPYTLSNGSQNIYNVARFTITFVPKGDKVSFRYVFASEEYPEFVCSNYNDIFGFFISGPGISGSFAAGGANIATIPGTSLPVTINGVNSGTVGVSGSIANCTAPNGSLANSAFYRSNLTSGQYPSYNGMTQVLSAETSVIPCSTYTIQITIGDVRDASYDSGVFLEAKSFSTPVLHVDVETLSLGGAISEGCAPGNLVFRLSQPLSMDRLVNYTVGGSATPGIDYAALSGSVLIPAGTTTVMIPIHAMDDGIPEGEETITVDVETDVCSTKRVTLKLVDRVIPLSNMVVDTSICPGQSVSLNGELSATVDSAKTFSNTIPLPILTTGVPGYRDIVVSGVAPNNLRQGLIARVCIDLTHNRMSDIDMYLFGPNGNYVELSTDNGGRTAGSMTQFCFSPNATVNIKDLAYGPNYSGDFLPEGPWAELWNDLANDPNGTWRLQITDDENGGSGILRNWSITFEPLYNITYAWTPSQGLSCTDCPMPIATPSASTLYQLDARDSYGCLESATANITHFTAPASPNISCSPGFDNLNFSWGSDANAVRFEVSIDNGAWRSVGTANTETLTGLGFNQTVNFRVRAVGPCASTESSVNCTTQNCTPFSSTATATQPSCAGSSNASITVVPQGGASPHTFTVNGISNQSGTFNNFGAGTYPVTVKDANGCDGSTSVTVVDPTAIEIEILVTPPSTCSGTFEATVTPSLGAGGPYTFLWNDGQSTATGTFATSGNYVIEVRDQNLCAARDSVSIAYPQALSIQTVIRPITCAGASDGRVELSGNFGTAPYSFSLGDGTTSSFTSNPVFDSLAPGTYQVHVRDSLGCQESQTIQFVDPAALTISITSIDVACNGNATGVLRASVSNARGPVTYNWQGYSSIDDSLTGLFAGSYDVIATDSLGCSVSATGTVNQPSTLAIAMSADSVLCFGESTGALHVFRTGGVAPFNFAFSTGQNGLDSNQLSLAVGNYSVVVTDSLGCSLRASARIGQPPALAASHTQQPISCSTQTNGSIDLRITGGREPYSYLWSDGIVTEDRNNLAAGTYAVEVTDNSACTINYQVVMAEPTPLRLNPTIEHVSCFGYNDAEITLAAAGGQLTYNYTWAGPNGYAFFGPAPKSLVAGTYTLEFRDAFGCRIDTSFVINQPDSISLLTTALDTICANARNGMAYVEVTGGTGPFTFSWDNGERGDTAQLLRAGLHNVTVIDAAACSFTATVLIDSLAPLSVQLQQIPVSCYRDSNGVVTVMEVAYGLSAKPLSNFQFAWRNYPDSTRAGISDLKGGQEVYLRVTDARACSIEDSIVVEEPAPLIASAQRIRDVSCYGGNDGSAQASVIGGTGPYRYNWIGLNNPQALISSLDSGFALVEIVDLNGCLDTSSVVIRQPDSIALTFTSTQVNCFAPNTGTINVVASGGNSPFQYSWNNGSRAGALDSLLQGMYVVTVLDSKGCSRQDSVLVTVATEVLLEARSLSVTCAGDTDGSIMLSAAGGNAPYTFRLDGQPFNFFPNYRFLAPGNYRVQARDRDGCPSEIKNIAVEEPEPVIVDAGDLISLQLGDSLILDAEVFNAVGEVSYTWLPQDSKIFSCPTCASTTIRPTFQGNIRVQAVDSRGCEAEDVIQVRLSKDFLVLVPTGFTPNDDGRDDRLIVHGKTGTRVKSFQVFNRWGELIHESLDFAVNSGAHSWDGKYRGSYAQPGTYLWKVDVLYLDGISETLSGQTTLVR